MNKKQLKYVMRDNMIDNFKVSIIENNELPSFTITLESHYLSNCEAPVTELLNQNYMIDRYVKDYNRLFCFPIDIIFALTEIPEKGFNGNSSSFIHNEVVICFDERKFNRDEMRTIVTNIMYDVLGWLNENDNFTYHAKKI